MENNQRSTSTGYLRVVVILLITLFLISVCGISIVWGSKIQEDSVSNGSIGGFIDIYPGGSKYTRYVIIGGRVFYSDKGPKDISFPETGENTQLIVKEFLDLKDVSSIVYEEAPKFVPDYARYKPSSQYYTVRRNAETDTVVDEKSGLISDVELYAYTGDVPHSWTQEADLDLFKNNTGKAIKLAPGTNGYFRFQLNNKSGTKLHVVVSVSEPQTGIHLPLIFNMKEEKTGKVSGSTLLGKDKTVDLGFDMEPDSMGTYCLNWEWPYESGNDEYDGAKGIENGQYILDTIIYVEETI